MMPFPRWNRACDMEHYEVKITPYALRQMQEITRYISATLQSPTNAKTWLGRMKKELAALSSMPERIPLTDEEPWHSEGIHKMVVINHLVYFWVDAPHLRVWITAVVYGRQNQREQLEQMDTKLD